MNLFGMAFFQFILICLSVALANNNIFPLLLLVSCYFPFKLSFYVSRAHEILLLCLSQVHHLDKASERYGTLNNILDYDVENDTVRSPGSLSRNLRRVRQGLDLIRVLFQNFLSTEYVSFFLYSSLFQDLLIFSKCKSLFS